jgi:hypothetical protein
MCMVAVNEKRLQKLYNYPTGGWGSVVSPPSDRRTMYTPSGPQKQAVLSPVSLLSLHQPLDVRRPPLSSSAGCGERAGDQPNLAFTNHSLSTLLHSGRL